MACPRRGRICSRTIVRLRVLLRRRRAVQGSASLRPLRGWPSATLSIPHAALLLKFRLGLINIILFPSIILKIKIHWHTYFYCQP